MGTAHCKQHTTHWHFILKLCTIHYTLHNANCTLEPDDTPNLTLAPANGALYSALPQASTRRCWRWNSAWWTSASSPTPSTRETTRTLSLSSSCSLMTWWEGVMRGKSQWLGLFRVGHIRSYLLKTDSLQVAIDCKSTGLPSHENPYAMDFQVSSFSSRIRHVGWWLSSFERPNRYK